MSTETNRLIDILASDDLLAVQDNAEELLAALRTLSAERNRLRSALVLLVGAETEDELRGMLAFIDQFVPSHERQPLINAINTLLDVKVIDK